MSQVILDLKQSVRAYLSDALACSALSEQVWLLKLAPDGTIRGRVCCYVGDECDMESFARRMVLAMLQSGAKRFVSVHYFPRESSEREIALRIFATSFERVERLLGLAVDDHFIVIGRGEQAWWRSLLAPD